eukprot:TRINITY_DN829_c0_g1_i8.p1 TRINITY_DN829_c0_g1~~TRINITY_DN829_c0_g1_i8.p1  ORF type:complete len:873 (+),score=125.25 TRINITY_DN829_c0_g1_i8:117-2735(+)
MTQDNTRSTRFKEDFAGGLVGCEPVVLFALFKAKNSKEMMQRAKQMPTDYENLLKEAPNYLTPTAISQCKEIADSTRSTTALPRECVFSIRAYTRNEVYAELNSVLRSGKELGRFKYFCICLIKGLALLPPVSGKFHRGIGGLDLAQVRRAIQMQTIWTWPGFSSTSLSSTASSGFGKFTFTIHGTFGRNISAFSQFPAEREVLFLPGTSMRVVEVTDTQCVLQEYLVTELAETDEDLVRREVIKIQAQKQVAMEEARKQKLAAEEAVRKQKQDAEDAVRKQKQAAEDAVRKQKQAAEDAVRKQAQAKRDLAEKHIGGTSIPNPDAVIRHFYYTKGGKLPPLRRAEYKQREEEIAAEIRAMDRCAAVFENKASQFYQPRWLEQRPVLMRHSAYIAQEVKAGRMTDVVVFLVKFGPECGVPILSAAIERDNAKNLEVMLELRPLRTGDFLLHVACQHGSAECARLLLKKGASLTEINTSRQTAVDVAKTALHFRTLKVLLDHDVDVHVELFKSLFASDDKSLIQAELDGLIARGVILTEAIILSLAPSKAGCEVLLSCYVTSLSSPRLLSTLFVWLCQTCNAAGVDAIVAAGALDESFTPTALHFAHMLSLEMLNTLLEKYPAMLEQRNLSGQTPLLCAVSVNVGQSDVALKCLISAGARLDAKDLSGDTALHLAVLSPQGAKLNALIAAGADVDMVNGKGQTALHCAFLTASADIMSILIAAGSDVNLREPTTGEFLLHLAVGQKWNDSVKLKALLKGFANINATDKNGQTALHLAVARCNEEHMGMLIAHGASVDIYDSTGCTALHRAVIASHYPAHSEACVSVAKKLIAAGANPYAKTTAVQPQTVLQLAAPGKMRSTILDAQCCGCCDW